jgi:hypothetical protein
MASGKGEIVCDDISPSGFYSYYGEIALRIADNNVSQIAWVAEQTERVINVTGTVLNNRRIDCPSSYKLEQSPA